MILSLTVFVNAQDVTVTVDEGTGAFNVRNDKPDTLMVIDGKTGNVGIGVNNPQEKLHIVGDLLLIDLKNNHRGANIMIADEDSNIVSLFVQDAVGYLKTTGDDMDLVLGSGFWGDHLSIKPNGNVGIGTTSPTEKLDVVGNIAVSGTVDGIDIATDVAANTAKVTDDDDGVAEVYGVGWDADGEAPTKDDVYDKIETLGTGSDDQKIDDFSISGNNVQLSLEDDGEAAKTVDISSTTAVTANTAKVTDDDDGVAGAYAGDWDGSGDSPTKDALYDKIESLGSGGGNTLDQAYDQGGAGVGRAITADAGAFNVGGVDGALFTGTFGTGTIPATDAGTRLMWYPAKAAFRVGYVSGAQWNDSNIGNYSTAIGSDTEASGENSTAMGYNTTASGEKSTAMGFYTTASGKNSTAMGYATIASGVNSTAMGNYTTASGWESTAMGRNTTASGDYSTAMGRGIQASGNYTVAIALDNQTGTNVTQANTMTIMGGNVGIGTIAPGSILSIVGLLEYADNAAALTGGLVAGDLYRTGDLLKIVH